MGGEVGESEKRQLQKFLKVTFLGHKRIRYNQAVPYN